MSDTDAISDKPLPWTDEAKVRHRSSHLLLPLAYQLILVSVLASNHRPASQRRQDDELGQDQHGRSYHEVAAEHVDKDQQGNLRHRGRGEWRERRDSNQAQAVYPYVPC